MTICSGLIYSNIFSKGFVFPFVGSLKFFLICYINMLFSALYDVDLIIFPYTFYDTKN